MRVAAPRVTAVILLALAGAATRAQGPQAPSQVRGRIVAAETGQPLPNARVAVNGTATAVRADLDGRFTIPAPASATLVITKAGFVRKEESLSTRRSLTQPLDIHLTRSVAVGGRVTNQYGEPVVGVEVWVAPPDNPDTATARSTTDDRGEYRIGGLVPGRDAVAVRTASAPRPLTVRVAPPDIPGARDVVVMSESAVTTYYPGTGEPRDATPIALATGDERVDLDVRVSVDQTTGVLTSFLRMFPNPTPPTNGTASISGTVVSSMGQPVPHAAVVLIQDERQVIRTGLTDEEGRYQLASVPAGSYRVGASKPGFTLFPPLLPLLEGGVTVTVRANQERNRVDVILVPLPTVSITGHVFDEVGEPVSSAGVALLVRRYRAGRWWLVPAVGGRRPTDDRGEFRIYGIQEGQYILGASLPVGPVNTPGGYAPTFFPGTGAAAEARFITVTAADELKGFDFSMVPTPTARVAGTLLNARGNPDGSGQLNLVPRSGIDSRIDAIINENGTFEFRNVPAGQYVLQSARGMTGNGREPEFAAYPVTVARNDVTGLRVQTSIGTTINGRVTFDGLAAAITVPRGIAFGAIPTDFDLAPGNIAGADLKADSTFELTGITGFRRLQATELPKDWMVKSITSDGVDVTDQPLQFGPTQPTRAFEVVLTDRINSVTGTVTDDRGRRVAAVRVVVFSTDRSRWYPASRFVRSVETGADGSFSITGMPGDSYFIAPAQRVPAGDDAWSEPAFLDSLRSVARSISIGEGDAQTVNLKGSSR